MTHLKHIILLCVVVGLFIAACQRPTPLPLPLPLPPPPLPSPVVKDGMTTGNVHFERAEYDKAIDSYSSVINMIRDSKNPNLVNAYYNRGRSYFLTQDLPKAIEDFNSVLAITPHDAEAFVSRAEAWEKQHHLDNAISDYTSALLINPDDIASYYLLGVLFSKKRDYTKTAEILSKAIAKNPSFADAYNGRGQALMKLGFFDLAMTDFRKACDLGQECGCIMVELLSRTDTTLRHMPETARR
jgi:tetratricopeptide (TPR) repeat protein